MDWAEDLKFSFKKSAAKKGRRAAAPTTTSSSSQQSPEESLDLDLDLSVESTGDSNRKAPPRRLISGGWADSGNKSARSKGKTLQEEERFGSSTINSVESADDDIPIIPDIDDIQDELLMGEIVEPPSVSVNRVVTLKELNSDLLKQDAFSSLEDVDLSILTRYLQSQAALHEPDEVWEWDQLFTEVTAEIHAEKSPAKSHGKEFEDPTVA